MNNQSINQSNFGFEPSAGYMPLGYLVDKDSGGKNNGFIGLSPKERLQNLGIRSKSGRGVTNSVIIPTIVQDAASNVFNLFVLDRKGSDVYARTFRAWDNCGQKVIYFNPWDSYLTCGFEPLWLGTEEEIKVIVESHIPITAECDNNLEVTLQQERLIFEAVIKAAQKWGACQGPDMAVNCRYKTVEESRESEQALNPIKRCRCRRYLCTLPAVAEVINRGSAAVKSFVGALATTGDWTDLLKLSDANITLIIESLNQQISFYLDSRIGAAFTRSDFILDQLVASHSSQSKGYILYVGAPMEFGKDAFTIASMMTELMVLKLKACYEEAKIKGHSLRPTVMLLEDFFTYFAPSVITLLSSTEEIPVGVVIEYDSLRQGEKYYGITGVSEIERNLVRHLSFGSYDEIAERNRAAFTLKDNQNVLDIAAVQPFLEKNVKYQIDETELRNNLEKNVTESSQNYSRRLEVNKACDAQYIRRPLGEVFPLHVKSITDGWEREFPDNRN